MKQISRLIFDEMRELGLINFEKHNRNNQITSRKKGKRKHYFVEEPVYELYLKNKE